MACVIELDRLLSPPMSSTEKTLLAVFLARADYAAQADALLEDEALSHTNRLDAGQRRILAALQAL